MEGRFRIFLLMRCAAALALFAGATSVFAETPAGLDPEVERRPVIAPRIGSENFEANGYAGVIAIEDFGTSTVYGLRLTYHVHERFFVQATYGMAEAGETSYEVLSGSARLLAPDERQYSYYDLGAGYNLMLGESFVAGHSFASALYLIGGAGGTHFAGGDHFTVTFGGGYRVLPRDWFSLDLGLRDHIFDSDLLGKNKTTQNIEAHLGASILF